MYNLVFFYAFPFFLLPTTPPPEILPALPLIGKIQPLVSKVAPLVPMRSTVDRLSLYNSSEHINMFQAYLSFYADTLWTKPFIYSDSV